MQIAYSPVSTGEVEAPGSGRASQVVEKPRRPWGLTGDLESALGWLLLSPLLKL